MWIRDRIGLCALALGIPAILGLILFVRAASRDIDRVARDCEEALRLGLPRPEDCSAPAAPPAAAGEATPPDDAAQVPSADGRTYERRRGLGIPWAASGARPVSKPAPEGRGPRPPVRLRPPPPRPGSTYVVQEGDTFLGIVRRAYGSTERWPDVWLENRHLVRNGEFLPLGTEIRLPR